MRTAAVPCLLASLVLSTGAAAALGSPALPDDSQAAFKAVAQKANGAIVTVKHVLKVEGGGDMGGDEQESEITAVMIDPGGLVVCANSVLLGQYGLMARFNPSAGMTVTPTDIKILIGDDAEGVEAKVLSRDTELDLAWLQIDKPSSTPYEFVDFKQSAEAVTGEPVITVGRLGKFFDRTLMLHEAHVVGTTSKPRDLIITDGISTQPGAPDNSAGMPIFTSAGKVLGIAVLQLPAAEDMQANGGGMDEFRGYDRMVLPAAEVLKATERAREMAATGQTPDDAAPPADGDKDAPAPGADTPAEPK